MRWDDYLNAFVRAELEANSTQGGGGPDDLRAYIPCVFPLIALFNLLVSNLPLIDDSVFLWFNSFALSK